MFANFAASRPLGAISTAATVAHLSADSYLPRARATGANTLEENPLQ